MRVESWVGRRVGRRVRRRVGRRVDAGWDAGWDGGWDEGGTEGLSDPYNSICQMLAGAKMLKALTVPNYFSHQTVSNGLHQNIITWFH